MSNDEFVLITSSILHDIGKIQQRFVLNKKHAELGYEFIKNMPKLKENDKERISKLIRYHHTKDPGTDFDDNDKYLLEILKEADRRSAAHDREDIDPGVYKDVKLEKIADLINLDNDKNKNKNFYELKTLENYEDNAINFGYRELYNALKRDIQSLDFNSNPYSVFNTLNTILFNDTVFAPSAFYYSEPNISLYHHLKLTAAIALSMYRYESGNADLIKTRDTNNSFKLLMCNISGIQSYIFRYYKSESADEKGTKRLKGRSFMIKLFTDSIESYIIKELNLYRFNVVWEKSDGFLLLFNNSNEMEEKLREIRQNIDIGLIRKKRGVSANIEWTTLSLDDFTTINNDKENNDEIYNENDKFGNKLEELYNKLDKAKRSKYSEIFMDDNIKHEEKFGESIKDICDTCGLDKSIKDGKCEGCLEEEDIGTNLYKKDFLVQNYYDSKPANGIAFNYGNLFISYDFSANPKDGEIITINKFGSNKYGNWRFILQGNYALTYDINGYTSLLPINKLFSDKMDHKMFSVFKADVDNMGAIVSSGFNNLTISRLASLSFQFEYFFSLKLNKIAEDSGVYIIYSGGDDVSAMGKIDDMICFISKFKEEFDLYFNNKHITISAGINMISPDFPLRRAIINTDENLEKSKEAGKNRITFVNTMEWNRYKDLNGLGDFIYSKIKENNISKGFPYFLYNLGSLYNRKIQKGTSIEAMPGKNSYKSVVIPDPMVYYYINRNYSKKRGDTSDGKTELINRLLERNDDNWKYMDFLSSYIVIKMRGEKNGVV